MIKAQELRIGNIVTDEFYETFKTKIVVESINEKGINLSVQNSNDFPEMQDHWIEPYYEFDKLRGIPLTSEWLERFGFQLMTDGGFLIGNDRYWVGPSLIGCLSLPNFQHSISGVTVRTVHQLQNLYFALTGSELQLKYKTV